MKKESSHCDEMALFLSVVILLIFVYNYVYPEDFTNMKQEKWTAGTTGRGSQQKRRSCHEEENRVSGADGGRVRRPGTEKAKRKR